MRNALLIALFSLFLLPKMGTNEYSLLSAQNMAYENGSWWLPDVNVYGNQQEMCSICGNYYDADEGFCHECAVQCEYCGAIVPYNEYAAHVNYMHPYVSDELTYCPFCNAQLTQEESLTHNCRDVTVTGDSGDGDDDNIYYTGYGGGYNNGGGNNNGSGNNNSGGNSNNNGNTGPSGSNNGSQYHIFRDSDVVVKDSLLSCWPRQMTANDCVPVSMEYAAHITDGATDTRSWFKQHYKADYGVNINFHGTIPSNMDAFVDLEFINQRIDSSSEIMNAINNHHPVLVTIQNTVGPHEIVIIGYNNSNEETEYLCIDPEDGGYHSHFFMDFLDGSFHKYEIYYLNPNTNRSRIIEEL